MLGNLPLYVQQSNIDQIRNVIQEAKAQIGKNWAEKLNYKVEDLARDAILLKDRDIVQLFLDEGLWAGTHAHEKNRSASVFPLIYFAAKVGSLPIVQLLVENGAQIKKNHWTDTGNIHRVAMEEAVEGGHVDIVRYLLQKGADPHEQYGFMCPKTYLGQAALAGHIEIVELLVSHGASVCLALHAIYSQNKRMLGYTIPIIKNPQNSSIDPNAYENGVQNCRRYFQAVQLLLDFAQGVDFREDSSSYGYPGLCFLEGLKDPGFNTALGFDFVGNLIGVSINGDPITNEMLEERGFNGIGNWLLTLSDIELFTPNQRGFLLNERLKEAMKTKGRIVSKEGIVNLVPLTAAVAKGDYHTVKVRLAKGESPNQKADFLGGETALAYAAKNGLGEIVELLADHFDIKQESIVSAALLAKKHKHTDIAAFLDSFRNVNDKDEKGNAPLHNAIIKGDVEEVRKLIARGANLSLKDGEGNLPLTVVVYPYQGRLGRVPPKPEHLQILKLLLASGANPNEYQYTSILQHAVRMGDFEAVEILLPLIDKNPLVRINQWDERILVPWHTGLVESALNRDDCWKELLDLLKKYDVELDSTETWNFVWDEFEEFSLKSEKITYLLQNGVNPDFRTSHGDTIMHLLLNNYRLHAEPEQWQWMIGEFLDHGLDVNAFNQNKNTLLHEAEKRGFLVVASYLIKRGANVSAKNSLGQTPAALR